MKVYAVSDLHTDYKENMAWVEAHCAETSRPYDALIVAGDVSDDLEHLRETLTLLKHAYGHVFYTPGNHEAWVRKAERAQHDSLGKLHKINDLCLELGVHTGPVKLSECLWVIPLWSWYHASWDREPDVPGAIPIEKVMMDFHACSWTSEPSLKASGDDSLAQYFDSLNDPGFKTVVESITAQRKAGAAPAVVSFSHFLPLQELLPEKRWLHHPNLAKACGSDYLAARVAALASECHVYGHTHFTQDIAVGGVRYVQWPLGYPREKARRRDGGARWEPLAVWDTEAGLTPQRRSYWGDFYRQNERQPEVVTPAAWTTTG